MSLENYESVLADLQVRRDQIDAAIEAIRLIMGAGAEISNGTSSSGQRPISPQNVPAGAFHRLSIVDATKKYLDMVKSKQPTPQILKALELGGLPPTKYNTLYAVLRRRQSQVGDIVKMGDEWGLTEWYPNNPNIKRQAAEGKGSPKKRKAKKGKKTKGSATAATPAAGPTATEDSKSVEQGPTIADLAAQILKEQGKAMSTSAMLPRMGELGRTPLKQNLANALRRDSKKRFKESGGEFDLASRGEAAT